MDYDIIWNDEEMTEIDALNDIFNLQGGYKMKVKNMRSNNGNKVANQFIIMDEEHNTITFQSYNSEIIRIDYHDNTITIFPDYDYSVTTGKYRNKFMRDYGFGDMDNKKGFEYYMNLGAIGNYKIVKSWEVK